MNERDGGRTALERRYRRLLALYPRAHRAAHGEEMLGVLLDGAAGRSRPGRAETVDLVWGAVQVRWQHALSGHRGRDRRDTLAMVSLVAPVLLMLGASWSLREIVGLARADVWVQRLWLGALADVLVFSAWPAALVLGLFGMRRASVVLAWLATAALIMVVVVDLGLHWPAELAAGWVLLSVFAAVAVTVSPGPRRGRDLLGLSRMIILAGTAAVLFLLTATRLGTHLPLAELVRMVVLVIGVLAACRPGTRSGRRAAAIVLTPLIAVPVTSRVILDSDAYLIFGNPILSIITYSAPVAITVGFAALLHRFDRHPRPGPDLGPTAR
ncbi:hypothetical protein [Amycolatopsis sp. NPDC059021]|uniref:hypothetical protein n=1 Tax=Amycolatopsis sp. NPDC059021 TaxID=3346704 RepID=UPI00366D2B1C